MERRIILSMFVQFECNVYRARPHVIISRCQHIEAFAAFLYLLKNIKVLRTLTCILMYLYSIYLEQFSPGLNRLSVLGFDSELI